MDSISTTPTGEFIDFSKGVFMKYGVMFLALVFGTFVSQVVAQQPVRATVRVAENATAQGVANIMARLGRVGHFGGNRGYEGCGMASTPQAAYAICCYANSGMRTVDVGYARGANGMWYCCRRYASR